MHTWTSSGNAEPYRKKRTNALRTPNVNVVPAVKVSHDDQLTLCRRRRRSPGFSPFLNRAQPALKLHGGMHGGGAAAAAAAAITLLVRPGNDLVHL